MLMAEAYGADIRLVASMQYLRVLIVALVATRSSPGFRRRHRRRGGQCRMGSRPSPPRRSPKP